MKRYFTFLLGGVQRTYLYFSGQIFYLARKIIFYLNSIKNLVIIQIDIFWFPFIPYHSELIEFLSAPLFTYHDALDLFLSVLLSFGNPVSLIDHAFVDTVCLKLSELCIQSIKLTNAFLHFGQKFLFILFNLYQHEIGER